MAGTDEGRPAQSVPTNRLNSLRKLFSAANQIGPRQDIRRWPDSLVKQMAFWLPSYRAFKNAIGEMTAAAAGIHVSVRVAGETAANAGGHDPWAELARRIGVRVDGVDEERVTRTASALGLVAIYSALDAFVRELRGDWHELTGVEWQQFKGDTPLQEIRRNAPDGLDLGDDESVVEYLSEMSKLDCPSGRSYVEGGECVLSCGGHFAV